MTGGVQFCFDAIVRVSDAECPVRSVRYRVSETEFLTTIVNDYYD